MGLGGKKLHTQLLGWGLGPRMPEWSSVVGCKKQKATKLMDIKSSLIRRSLRVVLTALIKINPSKMSLMRNELRTRHTDLRIV